MDDQVARFRRRATLLFGLLGTLTVVALLLSVAADDITSLTRAVAVVAYSAMVVATIIVLRGLSLGRQWAAPTTIVLCWLLIIAGTIDVLVSLTERRITIPLAAIGAWLVISADPRPPRTQRGAPSLPLLVAAACLVLGLCGPALTAAVEQGWLVGAGPEDLDLSVSVACDVGRDGAPARFEVTTTWHWAQGEPVPSSTDALVVAWAVTDGDLHLVLGAQPDAIAPQGIWVGAAPPSGARASQLENEGPALAFGIDLSRQRYADGRVVVHLEAGRPSPSHGQVGVGATYVHMDRWEAASNPGICEW